MTEADPITEADLHGYVDNQLNLNRRVEVEAYLSEMPQMAMRVMKDLRLRDELRLAVAEEPVLASASTSDAARRLNGAFSRRNLINRFRPAMAASVLLAAGWFAHGQIGSGAAIAAVPEYVDVAIEAYQTSLVRAGMYSQPEAPNFDRAELLSATAIVIPAFPKDWTITDVQVFPSKFGPSVEMTIRADKLGNLSLFAARPGHFAVIPATTMHVGTVTTAYWQIGDVAYALVGLESPADLEVAAGALAHTLY